MFLEKNRKSVFFLSFKIELNKCNVSRTELTVFVRKHNRDNSCAIVGDFYAEIPLLDYIEAKLIIFCEMG